MPLLAASRSFSRRAAASPPLASLPDASYNDTYGQCLTHAMQSADGPLTLAGTATYAGEAAYVFVFQTPRGDDIVAVRQGDCTRLVTLPLDR